MLAIRVTSSTFRSRHQYVDVYRTGFAERVGGGDVSFMFIEASAKRKLTLRFAKASLEQLNWIK